MYEQYKIISVKGHYEVYHYGKFFCSADTKGEALREIEEYESEVM